MSLNDSPNFAPSPNLIDPQELRHWLKELRFTYIAYLILACCSSSPLLTTLAMMVVITDSITIMTLMYIAFGDPS